MLFLKVLEIVFPVFFLGSLGFFWIKFGWDYPVKFVTRLATAVAVPSLVFVSLMNTQIDHQDLVLISSATFVTYFILMITFWISIKLLKINRRTFLAPLTFGNTGNIGLPIAYFAFGEVGLGYAVIIFSITAILSFSLGIWFVSGGKTSYKALRNEPLVISTVLGSLFLTFGWSTPLFLTATLELIAQMAIPLMLITLGVAVSSLKYNDIQAALGFSIFKLFNCLLVGLLVGNYFSLNHVSFSVLLLQISTPVAVTSYLLASKYEADAQTVAGLVIVSTSLSLVSIPLILLFTLG